MLPAARKARIMELVERMGTIKISELSKELGVTEMTVHRDIRPLVEEGLVTKTFGGIALASGGTTITPQPDRCVICSRPNQERLSFRLIYPDNRVEALCCAHCGLLRYRQAAADCTPQAICFDFVTHTTINAKSARFIMDSTIDIGCCKPQVLVFERADYAEKFVYGFGGTVLTFAEALQEINREMSNSSCSCDHG